jgi:hypothetical protein
MKRLLLPACMLACVLPLSLSATAQDTGIWHAVSKTAGSITGDIVISGDKLSINFNGFYIAQVKAVSPAELATVFDTPSDGTIPGNFYRLNIPGDKKFLRKNTLCGKEDVTYMLTYREDKTLQVAFFSGPAIPRLTPEARANDTSLCGTFLYDK